MDRKIRVTLKKSRIGASPKQRANLDALGLYRVNQMREHEEKPEIMGMVAKVQHLVEVHRL
jgi:large subunit ribosomal protein L30